MKKPPYKDEQLLKETEKLQEEEAALSPELDPAIRESVAQNLRQKFGKVVPLPKRGQKKKAA